MPEPMSIALFVVAALGLLITPGPAVAYVVARSVSQGRGAGLVSSLGLGTGALLHVLAAALGVSAVLASSASAFATLRWAGAVYLVVLGVRRLLEREQAAGTVRVAPQSMRRVFWEGALVNTLNPKTAIFFLAFLPQFVSPHGAARPQLVFLGMLFVMMAIATDSLWALGAGTAAARVRSSEGLARRGRTVEGLTMIGLGLATAVSAHRQR